MHVDCHHLTVARIRSLTHSHCYYNYYFYYCYYCCCCYSASTPAPAPPTPTPLPPLHQFNKAFSTIILVTSKTTLTVLPPVPHRLSPPSPLCTPVTGLIPLCGPVSATTRGLKWDLNKDTLEFGKMISSSNERTGWVELDADGWIGWSTEFRDLN